MGRKWIHVNLINDMDQSGSPNRFYLKTSRFVSPPVAVITLPYSDDRIRNRAFLMAAAMHTPTGLLNLKPIIRKKKGDLASGSCSLGSSGDISRTRKLPVLLFDVMDTIVRDPFYHDVPAFFG